MPQRWFAADSRALPFQWSRSIRHLFREVRAETASSATVRVACSPAASPPLWPLFPSNPFACLGRPAAQVDFPPPPFVAGRAPFGGLFLSLLSILRRASQGLLPLLVIAAPIAAAAVALRFPRMLPPERDALRSLPPGRPGAFDVESSARFHHPSRSPEAIWVKVPCNGFYTFF